MLEDKLLLRTRFENDGVLIETLYPARQLDSAHEVNRDVAAFLPGTIQKAVLYCVLLLYWFFHCSLLPFAPNKILRVIES